MSSLDPVLFTTAIVLFSLVIIVYAADLLVLGITRYSRKLGLSDYLSGLVIVAVAASMPEMITSIIGLSMNNNDILFGTILGSNMVHMALLTGIFIMAGKTIRIDQPLLEKTKLLMWILLLLPLALAIDGTLSQVDGAILIAAFLGYLYFVCKKEQTQGKLRQKIELKQIWKDGAIFLGSLVALLLAGRWLVFSSVQLAEIAGIPNYLLALIFFGIAGAIPDLAVELRSLFHKHQSIGIGDAIGSTMLELLLFFGIVALIQPISISLGTIANAAFWLYASITTVFLFFNGQKMHRWQGALLILFYVGFVAVEIVRAIQ